MKQAAAAGRFIAFEGGEGAGKSTQARLLADALRARGLEVVLTREPGGTDGAEAIRALLLDPQGPGWKPRAEALRALLVEGEADRWSPLSETLMMYAARADQLERTIRPGLARGAWVICDRFLDSSRAYQGGGSGLTDAELRALHVIGSEGLLPDLTLLFEVTPDIAAARLGGRGGATDRIEARDPAFHARVAAAFADFARAEPARFRRIDANGTPEATHHAVLAALDLLP